MLTKNIELINIIADENKVFKRIEDNEILGKSLWLGINDKAENYIEVDELIEDTELIKK